VSDGVQIQLSESSDVNAGDTASITGSDSLEIGLIETTDIDSSVILSDALAIQLTDSGTIFGANVGSDAPAIQVTEATFIAIADSTSDSPKIQIVETATVEDVTTGVVSKSTSDTFNLILSESATGYSTGTASDTSLSGLQESASIIVYVATTDSIEVRLQDDSRAVSVILQASDSLPNGYAEAVLQHVFDAAEDSLALAFDETISLFKSLSVSDDFVVAITEGRQLNTGGLVELATSDNVIVSISESGILYTRTVGTLSPLVATAEYIATKSRAVEAIGLPNTLYSIDGGLPYDAEVIATV
jgi:hypothetical protein